MTRKCQSCGMAIEGGTYCNHCVDENGDLQKFEPRFERMVQWQLRRGSSRDDAEREAIAHMANMPAWATHPEVKRRLANQEQQE
ncbi:MAG TPA: hypothetical protein ENJ90_09705 [Devosia sp.]|nr:hypothetical protein [Devosia sp.]